MHIEEIGFGILGFAAFHWPSAGILLGDLLVQVERQIGFFVGVGGRCECFRVDVHFRRVPFHSGRVAAFVFRFVDYPIVRVAHFHAFLLDRMDSKPIRIGNRGGFRVVGYFREDLRFDRFDGFYQIIIVGIREEIAEFGIAIRFSMVKYRWHWRFGLTVTVTIGVHVTVVVVVGVGIIDDDRWNFRTRITVVEIGGIATNGKIGDEWRSETWKGFRIPSRI